jgi:hypothetical protein
MNTDFLTVEESHQVDAALLSSRDKFITRIAIYALRTLKKISLELGCPVENITNNQVIAWVKKDETLQQQLEAGGGVDSFFINLVISALRPLKSASQEIGEPIGNLTVKQLISWFEKEAKKNL